jgi:hypothetical protein
MANAITKWYENKPGETSAMRIIAMEAVQLGALVVLSGVIGFFARIPDAVIVMSTGAGIVALALGAKAWQAQAEYKEVGDG